MNRALCQEVHLIPIFQPLTISYTKLFLDRMIFIKSILYWYLINNLKDCLGNFISIYFRICFRVVVGFISAQWGYDGNLKKIAVGQQRWFPRDDTI